MTAQSYELQFKGYRREPDKESIPAKSGIYCVYTSKYNIQTDKVSLKKLVCIGESRNIKERIADHEKWPDWRQHLRPGEEFAFNFAYISSDRERAEAAMINRHKPPENTEFVNEFPYDQTTITTSGRNARLTERFTVDRSRRVANR